MRSPDRHGTRRTSFGITRRAALRALFTLGAVAGTAGALMPLLGRRAPAAEPGPRAGGAGAPLPLERFSETYRGRHIEGGATVLVPAGGARSATAAVPTFEVRVDGRPLTVMRRADGGYLSLVNHYESFPTLRAAARAAVDDLGTDRPAARPSHGH
jgi:hypothetical protein